MTRSRRWRRSASPGAATSSKGSGGAQFALPGAVERLRAQKDDDAAPPVVLAATDPGAAVRGVL